MILKKVVLAVACLSFILSLCSCNKGANLPFAGGSEETVGTVGSENISAAEFRFFTSMEKNRIEYEQGLTEKDEKEKAAYWTEENKKSAIDKALQSITEFKILLINAKKENITLDKTDLDNIKQGVDQFVQQEAKGDQKKAEEMMQERFGITMDEYNEIYKNYTLAYTKYANSQPAKVEVSENDLKLEYEKTKEKYNKVTVKHVLVSTMDDKQQPLPEDKVAEKKKLAEEILEKAKGGKDFVELVKQYTEDPGSKDTGGEYTFGKGEMVPEFETWAFNAKEGDMDIVKTSYGFHVMKFIKRVDANFEDVKDQIKSSIQNTRFYQRMEDLKKEFSLTKNQKVIDSIKIF